jgi:predicted XRE-type DNA-binding protein
MNERPDTERIKAQLAADVVRIIAEQRLSDVDACARLGVAEAELAGLRMGEANAFSIDQLIDFLGHLSQNVMVSVVPIVVKDTDPRPIWERIAEIVADMPSEELEKLPTDLAANHDHYLYGAPKRY